MRRKRHFRSHANACKSGHPYVEGSFYINRKGRMCRVCDRERNALRLDARRDYKTNWMRNHRAVLSRLGLDEVKL